MAFAATLFARGSNLWHTRDKEVELWSKTGRHLAFDRDAFDAIFEIGDGWAGRAKQVELWSKTGRHLAFDRDAFDLIFEIGDGWANRIPVAPDPFSVGFDIGFDGAQQKEPWTRVKRHG
jgi:hypothetical protein